MTLSADQGSRVWEPWIVSGEGFKKEDSCEVWTEKLSQWRGSLYPTVDNFVTPKAPSFNRVQLTSTSGPQTFLQQSLRIKKNP